MDELLTEFLTETTESLDVVDVELVKFEQDPNNAQILDNIFRLVHTIKGTCGFLGLPRLEALAHSAETLMGQFREGIPVTPDAVSLILSSLDRIKELLATLEETQAEPEGSDDDLIGKLDELSAAGVKPTAEPEPEPEPEPDPDDALQTLERELKPGEVSLDELERVFRETSGPEHGDAPADAGQSEPAPEPAAAEPAPEAEKAEPAPKQAEATQSGSAAKADGGVKNQSIRVNVDTLEVLMTTVSELVLTRNALLEMVRHDQDSEFKLPLQRLSNVTAELQESVMKTRMQPVGNAWQKLPRIVRDLANELDKKIELEMTGAETELDRQVLELIKDPLTHMVRNSADHGLETTEKRREVGKSEVGKISLSAYHEGGHIMIEIADDGHGLNVERIKQKALENGLATQEELDSLSDAQIQKFIFKAGFSTAQKVTSVSGRGVGMDVVRSNLEQIGGSVDVVSVANEGTTFFIKIPLTLAIISALIVEAGGQRFAVPQIAVVELVRLQSGTEQRVEMLDDAPVLRLRDKLLPLARLGKLLDLKEPPVMPDETPGEETASEEEGASEAEIDVTSDPKVESGSDAEEQGEFIVVIQVGPHTYGIIVDHVFDTEEIVVKPMSSMLREIGMFSGNTILGDGSVIMIVDPNGIAEAVGGAVTSDMVQEEEAQLGVDGRMDSALSLLVFRAGSQQPKAVPLSLITRLEEIDAGEIEPCNGRELVQYRGRLMPLVHVDGDEPRKSEGLQPVLVFTNDDQVMGLLVDEIIDIIEEPLNIELTTERPGAIGSAVVGERATEIIDIGHYLPKAFDDYVQPATNVQASAEKRILLVDDSTFFRDMLSPVLIAHGFAVTAVGSAAEALKMRDGGARFEAIISDIDMPDMDGFAFAEAVAADNKWAATPIIALSSHTSSDLIERARQAKFADYVGKFDREGLIDALKEAVQMVGEAA